MPRRRSAHQSVIKDVLKTCLKAVLTCQNQWGSHKRNNLCIVSVTLAVTLTIILIISWYDPCEGRVVMRTLCQLYEKGLVAGSLCYPLCKEGTLYLSHCITQQSMVKEFLWDKNVIKVNLRAGTILDVSMVEPWEGMTLAEFEWLLYQFTLEKLGKGDHTQLVKRIMKFADFNYNGKLSIGEARSVWSLLQIKEFLLLIIFQDNDTFPKLNGTCGSVFSQEYVKDQRLYETENTGLFNMLVTNAWRWQYPPWESRAKIAVGLLEFIMDIYEKGSLRFYMCNIHPKSFGYTSKFDVKLMDIWSVLPENTLLNMMHNRSCVDDSGCMYSKSCSTQCNRTSNRCTTQLIKPNLKMICDILIEYLLYDAPNHIFVKLERLIQRCQRLDNRDENSEMEHAILLNDLQVYIWNQIKFR